ncbi:MAG: HEAT repeat domain-containing protein, partial [Deltaproteobacteria bacterium]|nr:HEAT repeat domain-containing protein [Deltaproteobacteria bacterium]
MKDLDIFMERLRSDDRQARHEAVSALAECSDEGVVSTMAGLLSDKDPLIRDVAYNALCSSPFKGAVAEAVVPLVYKKDDVGLRNTAVEILYGLGLFAFEVAKRFLSEDDEDILK